jgi:hypothetical protein
LSFRWPGEFALGQLPHTVTEERLDQSEGFRELERREVASLTSVQRQGFLERLYVHKLEEHAQTLAVAWIRLTKFGWLPDASDDV